MCLFTFSGDPNWPTPFRSAGGKHSGLVAACRQDERHASMYRVAESSVFQSCIPDIDDVNLAVLPARGYGQSLIGNRRDEIPGKLHLIGTAFFPQTRQHSKLISKLPPIEPPAIGNRSFSRPCR